MAPRPEYKENLSGGVSMTLAPTVDADQDAAIANLKRHIQVLWNHVERLEKMLAVGASSAVPEPTTQAINIRSVRDGSIATNNLSLVAARNIGIGASTKMLIKASKAMEVTCDGSVRIASGKHLTINASDEITFACGAATLTLKKDGNITLKGKDLQLDGTGRIGVKASSELTLKGSKINQN